MADPTETPQDDAAKQAAAGSSLAGKPTPPVVDKTKPDAPQAEEVADYTPVDDYTPAQWRERARDFKVSPHALAGALYGVDPSQQISRSDVQAKLDALERERGVSE